MYSIIGDLGYDIIIENGKRSVSIGGSGYHSLVGALLVSSENTIVGFISSVGDDFDIAELSAFGVRTDGIKKNQNEFTTRFIIEYHGDERLIKVKLGASSIINTNSIDRKILDGSIVHITATDPFKQEQYIDYIVNCGYKGVISVDVIDIFCKEYRNQTIRVLEKCDILFMNDEERKILEFDPNSSKSICVIKRAEKGADVYYCGRKYHTEYKINSENVINTTGAGDILAGSFIAFYDGCNDLSKSLDVAVKMASLSVMYKSSKDFFADLKSNNSFNL